MADRLSPSLAYLWWPAVKVMISKILEASSRKEWRLGLVRAKTGMPATSRTKSQSLSLSSVEQCTRVSSMSSTSVYCGQYSSVFMVDKKKLSFYLSSRDLKFCI